MGREKPRISRMGPDREKKAEGAKAPKGAYQESISNRKSFFLKEGRFFNPA